MKLTLVLLLILGLSLCLAQDTNKTKKARPLVNKTDDNGNMTHPHHPRHPPHPRPHQKKNETAVEPEAEAEQEATNATDVTDAAEEAARLLAGKRDARKQHEEKGHKEHKAPGKHLRGHHEKPSATGGNITKPAEPEENSESEEAQVNEEESVVAEQGEDAEEELARLLADKKVGKNKRGAARRGHRNGGKKNHHAVKPEEEVGENAEGVVGGEDAEDIESELRRLLPQIHQGNNNKKPAHAKKGGRPHWKKPSKVKPELKPEDFDFFGEHQIFGEDAFENGEDFGFDWNHHHHKKH